MAENAGFDVRSAACIGSNTPARPDVQIESGFAQLLKNCNVALTPFEEHHGAVFGLRPDFHLAYCNPAWHEFASDNGGEPAISDRYGLGASVLDALPPPLLPFYTALYRRTLDSGAPSSHVYECSSEHLFRRFQMRILPLGDKAGLLVVNALLVEHLHEHADRTPADPGSPEYRDAHGIRHQCCHCRRLRRFVRGAMQDRWDLVPEWVTRIPSPASHVMCPVCFTYHYGGDPGDTTVPPASRAQVN